jgi:hypothetical protein
MKFFGFLKTIIDYTSFEFLLTVFKWPNGGTIIFFRALTLSVVITFLYGLFIQVFDPTRTWNFSFKEFQLQFINSLTIFGAVFAAIYIALYTRFSSQWNYLANLYNQIKEVEALGGNQKVLSYWKAGFIEDAIDLHLARKHMFAVIINSWAADTKVRKAFMQSIPNGKSTLRSLLKDIRRSGI